MAPWGATADWAIALGTICLGHYLLWSLSALVTKAEPGGRPGQTGDRAWLPTAWQST